MNDNTAKPWDWLPIPAPHQAVYVRDGIWQMKTLADLARDRARQAPDFVCFTDGEGAYTFADVLAQAEALVAALQQ
ncbi:MAG: hypothetical protein B7X78_06775, partial [Sphingomonadales bacterium 39-62-4]